MARWKPSRFNLSAWDGDDSFLVFNSLSGAFLAAEHDEGARVADMLAADHAFPADDDDDLCRALAESGVLVPDVADELARADAVHLALGERDDQLKLILMPTEKCNFRCTYCYEDFVRGRMSPEVRRAVVRLVASQAPALRALFVSWFGGEPLVALDVIEDVTRGIREACERHGVSYGASMTTNGYLLTPDKARRCLDAAVSRFQVTLDGPPVTHNKLRILAGGGDTFETIVANLRALRDRNDRFEVRLRVNYTPAVVAALPEFLRFLGEEFGGDPRFTVNCHAVGRWGGTNDDQLDTCDAYTIDDVEVRFMSLAAEAGFRLDYWRESMRPYGSVCYAADPRSFVIGSDATVYKCTVAFDDPRNRIGVLTADGTLDLSDELHELWISSGEEHDAGCQACAFRPACQGNYCPLERLQSGQKTCPSVKIRPDRYLPVLAAQARRR